MKLTWFGGHALRIHVGGQILLMDGATALPPADPSEIASGADRVFGHDDAVIPGIDPLSFRPQRAARPIDDGDAVVGICRLNAGCVVIDAADEPPLIVVVDGAVPARARWMHDAVLVVVGARTLESAGRVLAELAPRLIVLAADEAIVDAAFVALRPGLEGTMLLALEPGLAVEV